MYSCHVGSSFLPFNELGTVDSLERMAPDVYYISDVSLSIDNIDGFKDASFTMEINKHEADYLLGKLGGHVSIYRENGIKVWEGIANNIRMEIGNVSVGVGPLSDVSNRVKMKYTEYDWGVPPVVPRDIETNWIEDRESILKWGRLEEVVGLGREMSPGEADRTINEKAKQMSRVKVYREISTGDRNKASVTFECLGYSFLLRKKYFEQYDLDPFTGLYPTGYWEVGKAIRTVIETKQPLLIGSGIQNIGQEIGFYVGEYGDPPELCNEVISGFISTLQSDSGYGFVFGVYEGREVKFFAVERPAQANYYISPFSGELLDAWGNKISSIPRPGEWVSTRSVNAGRYISGLPEAMFPIASVELSGNGDIRINEIIKSSAMEGYAGY